MELCAFYAAHGWDVDALDVIASASPLMKMFLDHAREQYFNDMQAIIGSAVGKALGG